MNKTFIHEHIFETRKYCLFWGHLEHSHWHLDMPNVSSNINMPNVSSSISNLVTLSLSFELLNSNWSLAAKSLLSLFFLFLFLLRTNLYSLTLFCFLLVFWLYLIRC